MASTQARSIWDPVIVRRAAGDAVRKLHPRTMARNPVMFVVEIGSVLTTLSLARHLIAGGGNIGFEAQITFWLWFTVLFANFAEAMAEGRGKAQADVGVAMNTGTQAAKEAGNMVDLDSNPTKLIEVVEIGKQLLITRGALTTFSIANDVAKYFAIIPAMFLATFPMLGALNVMGLQTPESAILSAVIFNALIIVALVPLALRGIRYRPEGAAALLRRNLLIYGVGGLVAPFIGIKAIDVVITALRLA